MAWGIETMDIMDPTPELDIWMYAAIRPCMSSEAATRLDLFWGLCCMLQWPQQTSGWPCLLQVSLILDVTVHCNASPSPWTQATHMKNSAPWRVSGEFGAYQKRVCSACSYTRYIQRVHIESWQSLPPSEGLQLAFPTVPTAMDLERSLHAGLCL